MNAPNSASPTPPEPASPPWWRVRMLWLVIGGPLAVVLASLVTAVLAVNGAEEVLTRAPAEGQGASGAQHVPALQGRNHAATPKP